MYQHSGRIPHTNVHDTCTICGCISASHLLSSALVCCLCTLMCQSCTDGCDYSLSGSQFMCQFSESLYRPTSDITKGVAKSEEDRTLLIDTLQEWKSKKYQDMIGWVEHCQGCFSEFVLPECVAGHTQFSAFGWTFSDFRGVCTQVVEKCQ